HRFRQFGNEYRIYRWFASLHVDDVGRGAHSLDGLRASICAASMFIRGPCHVRAETGYHADYTFVVGRNNHPINAARFAAAFPDMLDERLAADRVKRFPWKSRRGISRRNNEHSLHSHITRECTARRGCLRAQIRERPGAKGLTPDASKMNSVAERKSSAMNTAPSASFAVP